MSRRIADLLSQPEKDIAKHLANLEKHNGYPSHDARYIGQTHQMLRQKLKQLMMDPDDTTAEELFQALQIKFQADSQKLDWYYRAGEKSFSQKTDLVSKLFGHASGIPTVWAIKTAAAKKLLKQNPPKHVMKHLGYRSVDSLIKRQKISVILSLAEVIESSNWQKSFDRQVSKLDQTNFEARPIEITAMDISTEEPVIISDLTGTVSLTKDSSLLAMLVHVSAALSKYGIESEKFYQLNWVTGWWAETDNLIADLNGGQVSMNIHDVAASWLSRQGFENRQINHSRRSYWKQLHDMYENKIHLEETFDDSVMSHVRKLNLKGPQPAFEFEYVEDL